MTGECDNPHPLSLVGDWKLNETDQQRVLRLERGP